MKSLIFFAFWVFGFISCGVPAKPGDGENAGWQAFLNEYYDQRMKWFPLEATANGDNRYNDLLPVYFTESYQDSLKLFYNGMQKELTSFNRSSLNENDRISYDILQRELRINLEAIDLHIFVNGTIGPNLTDIPFNQFTGLPLLLGQMGSGSGNQPFKTVVDYDQWTRRAAAFRPWADSAIVYFRKGMAAKIVLPRALV